MKKLVFLVLIFVCFNITTVSGETKPVYVDTISRVSPVPVPPKCGALTSNDVKDCISCHTNVKPDYLEGLTLGCRECPETSFTEKEVQAKINLKLEVVPIDDLTYKIKGSITPGTCGTAYAMQFGIFKSTDGWITKNEELFEWPWGKPNPSYTTDIIFKYADTNNQFKLLIKSCSSCTSLCFSGWYDIWSDALIPSSGFKSTVTVLEDLSVPPLYSSKIDPWDVDSSYDIILSKIKYTLPAVNEFDFVTLIFGQALDGLVMNSTFVDISKPTPPDEEYPWNGTYTLRDGTDPRNGQKVPSGNYKVFVSIDGKTPSEGDKMINVMGIDLSLEGVDDDKEETVGGFVGVNNDDDNSNGTVDSSENPVVGENDLRRIFINQVVNTGKIVLRAEKNGDKIALWGGKEKNGTQITLPKEWTDLTTVSKELWVEGIVPSTSVDDNVILVLEYYEGGNKIQEDRVKITVMKVEIIEPNEDPVSDNNFTFNPASPGACNVIANGTSRVDSENPNLEWTLSAIAGSTLTSNPTPPKGTNITFTYTILPSLNDQFGKKTLTLKYPSLTDEYKDTQTVEIFFSRDATNNPGSADPNWYYYWSQALGVVGQHTYNGSLATSRTTVYSATNWTIEIGSNANWPGGNPPTGQKFINGFWATNLHEFWHRDHRVHNFTVHGARSPSPSEDIDGDGICDREPGDPPGHNGGWEAIIGTDPNDWNDTEDGGNWAESRGTYNHNALDWANPGSQSNN